MSKQQQKNTIMVIAMFLSFTAMVFMPSINMAGDLEPSAPPGPTMKTLDEIPPTWSQTLSASDRFELVLNDEAVLDKETGLVWAKDANYISTNHASLGLDYDNIAGDGKVIWRNAVNYCRNLEIGNRKGWRLPNVEELASLVDPSESNPALPPGYSSFFDNVQSNQYWSSTTYESVTYDAWGVEFHSGDVNGYFSYNDYYVWPVRGGSSPILVPHTP